jgi:MoxR-like ATPase
MSDWQIWDGKSPVKAKDLDRWLSQTPPWRRASGKGHTIDPPGIPKLEGADEQRGKTWRAPDEEEVLRRINLALWLRRPLLIEGDPGVGKSSLAYALAHGLGLGKVLRWEISSKTPYKDGLYRYDAVSHLRAIQANKGDGSDIENFVTLGPLGTALIGSKVKASKQLHPRVLLVDELDKADYDLPNDLLHVLEEAHFVIPELNREGKEAKKITMHDGRTVKISEGNVVNDVHPVVVITSNGERQFPKAFLRRCVQLELKAPRGERLKELVGAHFADEKYEIPAIGDLETRDVSPDRVIQTLFLEVMGMDREEVLEDLGGDQKR